MECRSIDIYGFLVSYEEPWLVSLSSRYVVFQVNDAPCPALGLFLSRLGPPRPSRAYLLVACIPRTQYTNTENNRLLSIRRVRVHGLTCHGLPNYILIIIFILYYIP
jgi:hypothetical protein